MTSRRIGCRAGCPGGRHRYRSVARKPRLPSGRPVSALAAPDFKAGEAGLHGSRPPLAVPLLLVDRREPRRRPAAVAHPLHRLGPAPPASPPSPKAAPSPPPARAPPRCCRASPAPAPPARWPRAPHDRPLHRRRPGAADLITLRGRDCRALPGVPLCRLRSCPPRSWRTAPPAPASSTPRHSTSMRSRPNSSPPMRPAWTWHGSTRATSPSTVAVAEQIRRLRAAGIPYTLTPGVPAFAAAARRAGTRTHRARGGAERRADPRVRPGLAMPSGETLAAFAATGATLAIHLAVHALGPVVPELRPVLRRGLPGRGRRARVLAGRTRSARHLATLEHLRPTRAASNAPRSYSSAPPWPPQIPVKARSTTPTTAAGSAWRGRGMNLGESRAPHERPRAVEQHDFEAIGAGASTSAATVQAPPPLHPPASPRRPACRKPRQRYSPPQSAPQGPARPRSAPPTPRVPHSSSLPPLRMQIQPSLRRASSSWPHPRRS